MFETHRCLIRRFREQDLPAFVSYRNNLEWMKYQTFKDLTVDEYQEVLRKDTPLEDGVQLAIIHRISGELLGDLYIKGENGEFWLGYTIRPQYARKGYAYEAASTALYWLKTQKLAVKIMAACVKKNVPSKKLLQKLGFTFVRFDAEIKEEIYTLDLFAKPTQSETSY